jgi:hypothetical protein
VREGLFLATHPRWEPYADGVAVAILKNGLEVPPDRTVSVPMGDPSMAFGRYKNDALDDFGKELAATCQDIITSSI